MNRTYKKLFCVQTLCLFAAMLLSGCSLLSAPEPLQIAVLNGYKAAAPLCASPLPVQVTVPAPHASAGLNTDRIAVLVDGREVRYMAGYRWNDGNAGLVQRALVDALNASGCLRGAGTGSMALRAEYRLEVDVKRMHFIHAAGQSRPAAEVSLLLRLIDVNSGLLVGEHSAAARGAGTGEDIFKGMEEALQSAVLDALDWLHRSLEGAQE